MRLVHAIILSIPLCFIGCDQIKVKDVAPSVDKQKQEEYSTVAKEVADSMKDVSKDDLKLMYAQFGGLHQYMLKTGHITNTAQLNKIFESFQKDYGYSREKYPAYSDKVEQLFLLNGMLNPKTIVVKPESEIKNDSEILRSKVLELIKNLGDGAKLAMETKVDA